MQAKYIWNLEKSRSVSARSIREFLICGKSNNWTVKAQVGRDDRVDVFQSGNKDDCVKWIEARSNN